MTDGATRGRDLYNRLVDITYETLVSYKKAKKKHNRFLSMAMNAAYTGVSLLVCFIYNSVTILCKLGRTLKYTDVPPCRPSAVILN